MATVPQSQQQQRLVSETQESFASGMWQSVARNLIPEDGAYDLVNLLVDNDGQVYRRGGPSYLSTSAFGPQTFLWDGKLVSGARTVIASSSDFGVLDGSEAPINLGGAGLSNPRRATEVGGYLFIPGDTSTAGAVYAGSRKTAQYSTGTASFTNGSKTVTGTGTSWSANADSGMIISALPDLGQAIVASVDSNTQITLRDAWAGVTAATNPYQLDPLATLPFTPNIGRWFTSDLYASAGNRLWVFLNDIAYFSSVNNPAMGFAVGSPSLEDFHRLPEGATILGGHELGDSLFLFATTGLHVISGIALDLTDASGNVQHTRRLVNENLILWSHEGIVPWAGGLVAPCTDSVWLVDGTAAPTKLSESIDGLYRGYVQAGHKTGLGAVYRNHYFLPILNSSNVWVDTLVCRLDRGRGGPRYAGAITNTQASWPWTHLDNFGARVSAYAVRTGTGSTARNPKLLGASTDATARVLDCNGYFGPDVTNKNEPDTSTHSITVETRDYSPGGGWLRQLVRRLTVRYELKDAGSDNPTLSASVGAEDGTWTALSGNGAEDEFGEGVFTWLVNRAPRFIRFRITSSSPSARFLLRRLEMVARPSGRTRPR